MFRRSNYRARIPHDVMICESLLQPQDSLPDVFVWVISSGRRVAYQRIPGRELVYSVVDEECGRHCGKVQSMFLKVGARAHARDKPSKI